jgi:transposase
MYKAFKYKLEPNKEQQITLNKWFGCSRWIWNWALTTNTQQYQIDKIKNRAGIAQINACGNTSSGDDVITSSSYVLMKQEAA